jgi:hypothetical protein
MILYAGATGGRRNLHTIQAHGWRLLFSSAAPDQFRASGWRYALDNGAWHAFNTGTPWDAGRFRAAVSELGAGADWTAAPDVVAGGLPSLRLSESWLPWLLGRCRRVLIPVQDGMTPADVAPLLSERVGLAIGGSTPWKLAQLRRPDWILAARAAGAWSHVLRVNTERRINLSAGFDSIDGTNPSRFSVNTPRLTRAAAHAACQQELL